MWRHTMKRATLSVRPDTRHYGTSSVLLSHNWTLIGCMRLSQQSEPTGRWQSTSSPAQSRETLLPSQITVMLRACRRHRPKHRRLPAFLWATIPPDGASQFNRLVVDGIFSAVATVQVPLSATGSYGRFESCPTIPDSSRFEASLRIVTLASALEEARRAARLECNHGSELSSSHSDLPSTSNRRMVHILLSLQELRERVQVVRVVQTRAGACGYLMARRMLRRTRHRPHRRRHRHRRPLRRPLHRLHNLPPPPPLILRLHRRLACRRLLYLPRRRRRPFHPSPSQPRQS